MNKSRGVLSGWGSLIAMVGTLLIGCTKEDAATPRAEEFATTEAPKAPVKFIEGDLSTGTYTVYKVRGSCLDVYGSINLNTVNAPFALVTATDIGLGVSSCTIDPNSCRFDRGATLGSWSNQWYVIYPNFGPSIGTRKFIKFRLKNATVAPNNFAYNQNLFYNSVTNTWSVSGAVSSGNFEIQVLSGHLTLCEIRG